MKLYWGAGAVLVGYLALAWLPVAPCTWTPAVSIFFLPSSPFWASAAR